jgi:hypothetical protein
MNGAPCARVAENCGYDIAMGLCGPQQVLATCNGGSWQVTTQISSCNPPMPFQCPPTLPPEGSPCPAFGDPTMICNYPGLSCPVETARCNGSWVLDRCEALGGEGGQPPNSGGAPDAVGGAFEQGGVGGSP